MKKSTYETALTFESDECSEDREVVCFYIYTPGLPGCNYLRNGDPGYPPEPAEVEIYSIRDKQYGVDLMELVSDEEYARLQVQILEEEEKQ